MRPLELVEEGEGAQDGELLVFSDIVIASVHNTKDWRLTFPSSICTFCPTGTWKKNLEVPLIFTCWKQTSEVVRQQGMFTVWKTNSQKCPRSLHLMTIIRIHTLYLGEKKKKCFWNINIYGTEHKRLKHLIMLYCISVLHHNKGLNINYSLYIMSQEE